MAVGCASPGEDAACDPALVDDDVGTIRAIHRVEAGELTGRCHGDAEPELEGAWEALSEVAPLELLEDLTLFATYDGDGETLAYAGVLDGDNTRFFVAVATSSRRSEAESTPADDELALTLVHELAHVFTQTTDQLDVEVRPEDCETLWNGLGCYRAGSYLSLWIERFWSDEALATLPADGAIDPEGGLDRCQADEGFVGPYAASHPEEDFAETFAAWVFSVEVSPAVEPRFDHLARSPELMAVRLRAIAAGRTGLDNNFGGCG